MIRRLLDSYEFTGALNAILWLAIFLVGFTILHVVAHILFAGSPMGEVVDSIVSYGN